MGRLDSLYRADNPWVLMDVASLQRVHDATPCDVLLVDIDPDLDDDDVGGKLPRVVKSFGEILGPLGRGLGIYNGHQEGESGTQIAVSQGLSAAAGAGAITDGASSADETVGGWFD